MFEKTWTKSFPSLILHHRMPTRTHQSDNQLSGKFQCREEWQTFFEPLFLSMRQDRPRWWQNVGTCFPSVVSVFSFRPELHYEWRHHVFPNECRTINTVCISSYCHQKDSAFGLIEEPSSWPEWNCIYCTFSLYFRLHWRVNFFDSFRVLHLKFRLAVNPMFTKRSSAVPPLPTTTATTTKANISKISSETSTLATLRSTSSKRDDHRFVFIKSSS